jgi:hypothetical protein
MPLHVSSPVVRLPLPAGHTLSDFMGQIRSWLDAQKIEISLFKIDRSEQGELIIEIAFSTSDAAASFHRNFGQTLAA